MAFSNCPSGKRRYRDAKAAQSALDQLIQRWNDGTILDPCFAQRGYLCPDCKSYHLSKQPARRFQITDVFPTLSLKGKS